VSEERVRRALSKAILGLEYCDGVDNHMDIIGGQTTRIVRIHSGYTSVLDVGCGPGKYLNWLNVPIKLGLDVFHGELAQVTAPTVCEFAELFLPTVDNGYFDVVICLDCIEHMVKHVGIQCIKEMQRIAAHAVILFTPYGWDPQDDDLTGHDNPFQMHLSAWYPPDLEALEFEVEVWENFDHGKNNSDGPRGAIWAVWRKQ